MRIISRRALRDFWEKHRDAKGPLLAWWKIAMKANWESLADSRQAFPHADLIGVCTVFNIKGNSYRLITKIYYRQKKVFIRNVLTHTEYDKGKWKDDCNC